MKDFPKKYNSSELGNRSKQYKNIIDKNSSTIFSMDILPSFKKLSYSDFFMIYLRDFFNKKAFLDLNEKSDNYEQLFLIFGDHLESIASSYQFFIKKNQSLLKIGSTKLERHILSSTKKCIKANHKILDSYLSSDHKIYLPDLDLYTYILGKFHSLWDRGKIISETKIGYWSFNLQTSIPSEKILRKKEKIPFYVLKYFIGAKGDALYVPIEGDIDVCCGDVALLVHPKDKRYSKYIGKNVIIPLCNRQIPVIGDENVNIAVNNGIQRVCPCSDEKSIQLAKKFGLPMDIYAFNRQGLYTEYIHEPAFIGKERKKYYNNIVEFIGDIGNIAEIGEKEVNVPYLDKIDERLVPYKIDHLVIDLKEEKQKVIDDFFEGNISYSALDDEISKIVEINDSQEKDLGDEFVEVDIDSEECDGKNMLDEKKQKVIGKLNELLPDSLVCNSQILFGWKLPLIRDFDDNLKVFDIEKDCLNWKQDSKQICFDFVVLSLIRLGVIKEKGTYGETDQCKVCEYDKFYKVLSENENKVEYFIHELSKITGEKDEYLQFMKLIENLSENDESSISDLRELIKNCNILEHKGIRLLLNMKGIVDDVIDLDFIHLCMPCYLVSKGIKTDTNIIFSKNEEKIIFKELLVQQLLLGEIISNKLVEENYCKEGEFLGSKDLTKFQIEQSQRDFFSLYGENPVRLNLLINKTFDKKEIVLNGFFLKQIRNAVRLCIQKKFLPSDITVCLDNQPEAFDDYDVIVLNKMGELLEGWRNVSTYQEYCKFFCSFKEIVQNLFFSWYLEVLKVRPTKNAQFVCSYFFNFLVTILYPLTPQFVEALQYVSEKSFLNPLKSVKLNKNLDYNISLLYDTFMRIKQLKIENGIKQHKDCNIFIKTTPTICDIFAENEQVFKNYFHASEINYVRLHEANPLGYEIFSDELITIGIQNGDSQELKEKDSIDSIERDIKNLEDRLDLLRQRLQMLPEGEQRTKAEEEYAKTKEEIENLTIKHSLLSSK